MPYPKEHRFVQLNACFVEHPGKHASMAKSSDGPRPSLLLKFFLIWCAPLQKNSPKPKTKGARVVFSLAAFQEMLGVHVQRRRGAHRDLCFRGQDVKGSAASWERRNAGSLRV